MKIKIKVSGLCVKVGHVWIELCCPKQVWSPDAPVFGNRVCRCSQVKRSLWWALIQYDWCPYKKREEIETHREDTMWQWKQRLDWHVYKPRNTKDWQSLAVIPEAKRKAWNRFSPRDFRKSAVVWMCTLKIHVLKPIPKGNSICIWGLWGVIRS